jgi:hypothetical protein
MIPTIKLIAYGSRDPNKVFVAVPNELARYVLTDRCVVERGCGFCKAQVGEPCNNGNGKYWSGTHADRRGYNPRGRQRPGTPTEPQDHIATERDWILI